MTGQRRRGTVAAVAVLLAYAGSTALLGWATSGLAALVREPGPPALDAALGVAAAGAAWLVLTWLALTALLALAADLLRRTRPRLQRLADRVTPALVRRAAAGVLGAGLASGVVATGASAHGPAEPPAGPAPSPSVATAPLTTAPPSHLPPPSLDRPADPLPGWTPDRPSSSGRRQPPTRVHLVASQPHREQPVADEVVVRRGDSLWDIAARHLGPQADAAEVAREWPRWHQANRDLIGADPDLILPGQQLSPPPR